MTHCDPQVRKVRQSSCRKGITTVVDIARLPGAQLDRWEWQIRAACRGMDSVVFFHPPQERNTDRERRVAAAKAICQLCPVITDCLAHALKVQESYGIWGGLSETERAAPLGVQSLRYPAPVNDTGPARGRGTAPQPNHPIQNGDIS